MYKNLIYMAHQIGNGSNLSTTIPGYDLVLARASFEPNKYCINRASGHSPPKDIASTDQNIAAEKARVRSISCLRMQSLADPPPSAALGTACSCLGCTA
jgi:hypothetical protein